MNAVTKNAAASSNLLASKPANDAHRLRVVPPRRDHDPFTRGYLHLERRLRAACAQIVDRDDVSDLVQDVWLVASQSPAKLAQSDTRTLSWLVGIARRCARSYGSPEMRLVPLDELLAREAGDDLDGREMYEDVTELRAERWEA